MNRSNLPPAAQTLELLRVSYHLTTMYQSIHLVRIDQRTDNIVVIAGEDIVIEIDPTGARKVL
ncbi:MAG: hypothetical protein ACAF41_29150 [Leptolyngbya sp. BL-A-14]